jgi:hypothetical protein
VPALQRSRQEEFVTRFREYHRANIAAVHDDASALCLGALHLDQVPPHCRHGRYLGDPAGDFLCSDGLRDVPSVQDDQFRIELQLGSLQKLVNFEVEVRAKVGGAWACVSATIGKLIQLLKEAGFNELQGNSPVHGAGVNIITAQRFGHLAGNGALARTGGAVQRDLDCHGRICFHIAKLLR